MASEKVMTKIARFIVEKRVIFFVLFAAAFIYCGLSLGKVRTNSDITKYLPADTQTRRGLTVMEEEFTTFGTAEIMISNITYEEAVSLAKRLESIAGVDTITLDDTKEHYSNAAALLSISFAGAAEDESVAPAMREVRETVADYDAYVSTDIGSDYMAKLAQEMVSVLLVAVAVIVAVLLFTSKSYFEVVVFFLVFVTAAVLNMGTNYLLGEISSITNSIAIILQLALAIDYSIIFCHRYQEDMERYSEVKAALVHSLSKAIIEISSSSLTTISGLVALTLMQFKLGYDLGIVLSKGILCSLITVFLLMPGLIMLMHKPLERSRHKNLVPNIRAWGEFLVHTKIIFVILFVVILPAAYITSSKCDYVFDEDSIDAVVESEDREIENKIHSTFEGTTAIALMVPVGDYESEKAVLNTVAGMENVRSATGLAAIEIEDGKVLTDLFTPREFAELVDMDIETGKLLYGLYGVSHEQYQPIFGDMDGYAVPLLDIFEFMFDKIDQGMVTLGEEQRDTVAELRETLDNGLLQLRGDTMTRMVFTAAVPVESREAVELTDKIRAEAEKYYDAGDVLVTGNVTSAEELSRSFGSDNIIISVLTAAFVFVILLFTFRSFGAAFLLVLVIQGSIWINFSFPVITGTNLFFLTYLIVSAIQMGATIDYAIVLTNRFLSLKRKMPVKEAIAEAVNQSFATIFTSGSIMITAGFLIGYLTTDIYIGSIGLALGRGTLISVICVLTVLPQVLYIGSKFIEKTTFSLRKMLGGEK